MNFLNRPNNTLVPDLTSRRGTHTARFRHVVAHTDGNARREHVGASVRFKRMAALQEVWLGRAEAVADIRGARVN